MESADKIVLKYKIIHLTDLVVCFGQFDISSLDLK